MPIRIKPIQNLKPCVLNLESLQEITTLVEKDFSKISYSATDEIWEIYDEPRQQFITAISERDTLDSFIVKAKSTTNDVREIEMIFNSQEATIKLTAPPNDRDWFEHFMIDLKKHILPPTFSQRFLGVAGQTLQLKIMGIFPTVEYQSREPYCKIILRQKTPNPMIENIKANLISNVIWLVIGAVVILILQWIFKRYGIDLNPLD